MFILTDCRLTWSGSRSFLDEKPNLGPIWVHNLPNTVHYRAVRCRTELDESST